MLYRCPEKTLFHLIPEMVGAFGSSPVLSTNLTIASQTRDRRWFDLDLLETLSTLHQESARLSVEAMTAALFKVHAKRQGYCLPSQSTVRKQLGKALEEYENVKFQQEQEINSRVEEPSLLGCCPCCSPVAGKRPALALQVAIRIIALFTM